MTVEADVVTHLATLVAELALDENLFTGPERPATDADQQHIPGAVPDKAVFCLGTGGFTDQPQMGGSTDLGGDLTTWPAIQKPTVQLWVRSDRDDYDGGKALVDEIFRQLNQNPPTNYFNSRPVGSQAAWVKKDDLSRDNWTINLELMRKNNP